MLRMMIVPLVVSLGLAACNDDTSARSAGGKPSPTAVSRSVVVAASATPVRFRCGGTDVRATFVGEQVVQLGLNGTVYTLGRTPNDASAAYVTARGATPTIAFWNKTDGAMLEIDGQPQPGCVLADGPAEDAGADIIGIEWRLSDMDGVTPIGDKRPSLTFENDERVSGHAGCNRFSGAYDRTGDRLTIGPLVGTRMACLDAAMNNQESTFLGLLGGMTQLALLPDGSLLLTNGSGRRLTFSRSR